MSLFILTEGLSSGSLSPKPNQLIRRPLIPARCPQRLAQQNRRRMILCPRSHDLFNRASQIIRRHPAVWRRVRQCDTGTMLDHLMRDNRLFKMLRHDH